MLQRPCVYLKSHHLNVKQFHCTRFLSNHNQTDVDDNDRTLSPTLRRLKEELNADKKTLKWRKEIGERPEDWSSKLKLFANKETTSDYVIMMQQPINLSPKAIKDWWKNRKEKVERHMQQFVRERLEILGPELAVAHFILYRGGAVRFTNSPKWMRADENGEFDLPNKYEPQYKVEAIRCDNMLLYYEGLENIRNLRYLKFLSFHNVQPFDDWCLDRVSGSELHALEILDISGTQCTDRGLSCLYRLSNLKLLIVDDPHKTLEYELTCAMLCEALPQLKITAANKIHEETDSVDDGEPQVKR